MLYILLQNTHSVFTHTLRLTAIFPGEPGLAGCPLKSPSLFIPWLRISFWDRPKLSMSFLTQSHQVFFGHPLSLIPSTSHVIQRLTQSLSSFRSTYPNHLNLFFFIIKLTGSNPKSSLSSSLFLPVIQLNPTHPSDHTHFRAIQLQFMLYFHWRGLTAMHQTTPHTRSILLAEHKM